MLEWTIDPDDGVVDIMVDGAIARADYERLVPELDAVIAKRGELRVVETVRKVGRSTGRCGGWT